MVHTMSLNALEMAPASPCIMGGGYLLKSEDCMSSGSLCHHLHLHPLVLMWSKWGTPTLTPQTCPAQEQAHWVWGTIEEWTMSGKLISLGPQWLLGKASHRVGPPVNHGPRAEAISSCQKPPHAATIVDNEHEGNCPKKGGHPYLRRAEPRLVPGLKAPWATVGKTLCLSLSGTYLSQEYRRH